MRILVLFWHMDNERMPLSVRQHLDVLEASGNRHQVLSWNMSYGAPPWKPAFCRYLEAVVLHTTLLCCRWFEPEYFGRMRAALTWVKELNCTKIAIPQDEYDHSEVLDEWLCELGVSVIFSYFAEPRWGLLYPVMRQRAAIYPCLWGYIDDATARACETRLPRLEARPYDVVYRASRLPYWFGRHGQLKHRVGGLVAERARAHGLTCDISTRKEDAIMGERWLDFLSSGKTVIGCESGSSVLDRRGEVRARVLELVREHPAASFEEIDAMMPTGWDGHEFFGLSPRHLEAVITKTCQVLVEGHYSGVLRPYEHYIPVRRDFSNVDDVLEQIRDMELLRQTAERAYREVFLSGRYTLARFAEQIESAIIVDRARRSLPAQGPSGMAAGSLWWVGTAAARLSEDERQVARGFFRRPHVYLLKAGIALKLLFSSRLLRSIMLGQFLQRQRPKGLRLSGLVLDLFLLRLLQELRAGRLQEPRTGAITVRFHGKQGVLQFRSEPVGWGAADDNSASEAGGVTADDLGSGSTRIVWDHSAVGAEILYPLCLSKRIAFFVGAHGIHEFHALGMLVQPLAHEIYQECVLGEASPMQTGTGATPLGRLDGCRRRGSACERTLQKAKREGD